MIQKEIEALNWNIYPECHIGTFSFQKVNMYEDLINNEVKILRNTNIRKILKEPIIGHEFHEEEELDPLTDLLTVVDADSSQLEAIKMARSGKSFVLQGPPGTGKSQTITNIISDLLYKGKKVLFVSEKLAALEVVFNKLKNVGLEEFCLQLHSDKANKKEVISDIYKTLNKSQIYTKSKWKKEKYRFIDKKKKLEEYENDLHKKSEVIDKSIYELFEDISSVIEAPDINWYIRNISQKDETYLYQSENLLEQYKHFIPRIGRDYRKNPWFGYINKDNNSYQSKLKFKSDLDKLINYFEKSKLLKKRLLENYQIRYSDNEELKLIRNLFNFLLETKIVNSLLLNKENFNYVLSNLSDLKKINLDINSSLENIESVYKEGIFDIDATSLYFKLLNEFNGKWAQWFNKDYKNILKELSLLKRVSSKLSYDEAISITYSVIELQDRKETFFTHANTLKRFLNEHYKELETDWDYISDQLNILGYYVYNIKSFGNLIEDFDFRSEKENFYHISEEIDDVLNLYDLETINRINSSFDDSVLNINILTNSQILERLKEYRRELDSDSLEHWIDFRSLLTNLKEKELLSYIDKAIDSDFDFDKLTDSFTKIFYRQWIDQVELDSYNLKIMNRFEHDEIVKNFIIEDKEQFERNKAILRAKLSAERPSISHSINGSSKKLIENEYKKSRRQMSVRKLLSAAGEFIQRIKPLFLMSPLSVSAYLSSTEFDTIIFDEASQIFPQDAIGAIYRGKQLIVVGDSKQMPPSNYFNSSLESDYKEEYEDIDDYESILDLCSAAFDQISLNWHYRSRYEQLISFSNKNFYDNNLVTFPSSKIDKKDIGVDFYYVNGIFDRKSRSNYTEAKFIVDKIYENIRLYPNRSIGVVAFSIAQQNLIEDLLLERRKREPAFEKFFSNEVTEPFFIKNLETVQGDERDTIIFSIAYARDKKGNLYHNFGPLNREGGERRLNVAFTRAKHNIQIISSIRCSDLDLNRTSAKGPRLLKEYLEFAEKTKDNSYKTEEYNPYEHGKFDLELEVFNFLKSKGYSVEKQIGASGYKIDIGVKSPKTSDFVLAIELDGENYHSFKNVRDRDRLRKEVLEGMGWQYYRVWAPNWFKNKKDEQERLLDAVANALYDLKPAIEEEQQKETITYESIEETIEEVEDDFPTYQFADIEAILKQNQGKPLIKSIRDILETEAPMTHGYLLKRLLQPYFKASRKSSSVNKELINSLRARSRYGIIKQDDYYYLEDSNDFQFRKPARDKKEREFEQIPTIELKVLMKKLIKENGTVNKKDLFHEIGNINNKNKVGGKMRTHLEKALALLSDELIIDGDQISLK